MLVRYEFAATEKKSYIAQGYISTDSTESYSFTDRSGLNANRESNNSYVGAKKKP